MRIKLIYPKTEYVSVSTKAKQYLVPPQGLLALASVTPRTHEVEICDEGLTPLRLDDRPDLVGITVHIASAPRAYAIAQRYRARGIPVVLGGLHVSAMPDEAEVYADAVVVGEADEVWPKVVADAEAHKLQKRYDARPPALDALAISDRDRVPSGAYLTRNALLATRGCNRSCRFCYRSAISHSPFRRRPVERVVEEVEQMEGNYFVLLDDNLAADHAYARRLFRALKRAGKVWMGAASIDVGEDERLLDAMAESGCISLFIGIETIRQSNLDAMSKFSNRVSRYADAVRRIRRRGIMINGSFVFGFDGDDESVFDRTTDWAREHRLDTATFHILTPYPGTPLFAGLEREGRILDRDWRRYDTAHVVFQPKRMTPDALQAGYERAYRRFYSLGNILHRVRCDRWARAARLILNVGYKRMNPFWPLLARMGLASAPFRIFVKATVRHDRTRLWNAAEASIEPATTEVR